MAIAWNKLDSGLAAIYSNFLEVKAKGLHRVGWVHPLVKRNEPIQLVLQYQGDLAPIEARGFTTTRHTLPGMASGSVKLDQVERIVEHPNVVQLSFGQRRTVRLDRSVPSIRANTVWTRNTTTNDFTGFTGEGVVIGIIDTGIDFGHVFFRKTASPITTRIQRIWDQGLTPRGAERTPRPALLGGNPGYGVEYTKDMIEAFLQRRSGALEIRHRDCSGHGTHVASIAAGDGRDAYTYVGVAPEAELVIVKLLYPETMPSISEDQRIQDAVTYILEVARQDLGDKPVVINFSAGGSLGPHDGLGVVEQFLDATFGGASRRVFVNAAGNDGDASVHATVTVGAGGSVRIPLELFDEREASDMREYDSCRWEDATQTLEVEVWYPNVSGVTFLAELPRMSAPIAGPALDGDEIASNYGCGQRYVLQHASQTAAGVTRNRITLLVEPRSTRHERGDYAITLRSPVDLTAEVWCYQYGAHGFKVHGSAGVAVTDRLLINDPGGATNVITVAAYNAEVSSEPIVDFSSRGPMKSWDPARTPADKPEIAAPGRAVDAALSRFTIRPGFCSSLPRAGTRTTPMDGTSMATPHVTGVIALMFHKNGALSLAQVRDLLRLHGPRPAPGPVDEWGWGKVDARDTVDNVP